MDKKYKIRINYRTGDSFKTSDTHDFLELTWDDLDVAKRNLQNIKEHYNFYKAVEYPRWNGGKSKEQLFEENKNKEWFIDGDEYEKQHCIKLFTDEENEMQMHCFWCGYFETLHGAEIEIDESDMKFEM